VAPAPPVDSELTKEPTRALPRTPVSPTASIPPPSSFGTSAPATRRPKPAKAPKRPKATKPPKAAKAPKAARQRNRLRLPRIDGRIAAVVTGAVIGVIGVFLGAGATKGCTAVKGNGGCGGLGILSIVVILAAMVLLGGLILRAAHVDDPTSTSFLGVALVAVIAMLFFLGSLDSRWMLVVIPCLTAVTFLLSWWVTQTFVETAEE
jgi:hypothetical protein